MLQRVRQVVEDGLDVVQSLTVLKWKFIKMRRKLFTLLF
jgi:hypothetical protein